MAEQTEQVTEKKGAAEQILDEMSEMKEQFKQGNEQIAKVTADLEELKKPRNPYGPMGFPAPTVRTGENIMSSRGYRLTSLARALAYRADNTPGWEKQAKIELDLSNRLREAYYDKCTFIGGNVLCPLGSSLMPRESDERELPDGDKTPGLPNALIQESRQLILEGVREYDPDELSWVASRSDIISRSLMRKDLSADTATSGATLVGLATQGELIELLRAQELFSRVGAQQIDFPPQGRIRFPSVTGSVTIAAYSEGATVTESTPTTGALELSAKAYSGLVDIPDELMKFATSVSVEAWLRTEFTRELALQADSDMINGDGGTAIQGVLRYSALRSVTANTTGANGDTLEPEDPTRLYADIADQNAPVDAGFFFSMTNTLWGALSTRRADAVSAADGAGAFVFAVGTQSVGGGRPSKTLNGELVATTTQIPTNRTKGSGTTLTLLLGGVGPEWIIARAGVVDIAVTNSDASKFQSRISTMRGTSYVDAGPKHENSFGKVDQITNS